MSLMQHDLMSDQGHVEKTVEIHPYTVRMSMDRHAMDT